MIELRQIHKSFGSHTVIERVNLSVLPGELVVLQAPSGAGKTTLLDIGAGLLRPDRGTRSTNTQHLAYAFQDDRLIPWCTALENVLFALPPFQSVSQAQTLALQWLTRFGLAAVADRKPSELSGGMKRRVNLARAFSVSPQLLMLDEPFAFQDQEQAGEIARAIQECVRHRQSAVLIATHDDLPAVLTPSRVVRSATVPLAFDSL